MDRMSKDMFTSSICAIFQILLQSLCEVVRIPPVEQLSKAAVHPPESQPCFLILRNCLAKQPSVEVLFGDGFFPAEHWVFTTVLPCSFIVAGKRSVSCVR